MIGVKTMILLIAFVCIVPAMGNMQQFKTEKYILIFDPGIVTTKYTSFNDSGTDVPAIVFSNENRSIVGEIGIGQYGDINVTDRYVKTLEKKYGKCSYSKKQLKSHNFTAITMFDYDAGINQEMTQGAIELGDGYTINIMVSATAFDKILTSIQCYSAA